MPRAVVNLWYRAWAWAYLKLPQLTLLLATAWAITVCYDEALARAGGGGGYRRRTGGGGSGGGSGAEGVIVEIVIRLLIRLCIEKPIVGIPLTIAVIVIALKFYRNADSVWNDVRKDEDASGNYEHAPKKVETRREHVAAEIGSLKRRDQAFSETQFKERVKRTFLEVQSAWTACDLRKIKPLVTGGLQERFEILLEMNKRRMLHNVTKEVQVSSISIRRADSDDIFDSVQVRIDASAVDYHERLDRKGEKIGRSSPQPFAEYWSFLRKRGAKSLGDKGLAYGTCPCCGAGLKISDRGECEYCRAVVNSGEHDWVLAEITQTAVGDGDYTVNGLAAMKQKDPAFNAQYVEDRVSLMFWRLRAGEMMGSQTPVLGIARSEFVKKRSSRYALHMDGRHAFFADAAIGGVELNEVELGQKGGAPDRLHVRIKWSGREVKAKLPTFVPIAYEEVMHRDQSFILERAAEAITPVGKGMAARGCGSCGAPETRASGAICERCKAPLASGTTDWVLADVREYAPVRARQLDRKEIAPSDARARHAENDHLVAAAAMVLLADGRIGQRENAWLQEFARQRDMTPKKLTELIQQVQRREFPEIRIRNELHKQGFLDAVLRACMADGEISSAEEALIMDLARRLKMDLGDVEAQLKSARSTLARSKTQSRPPLARAS